VNNVSGAGPAGLGEVRSSIRIALYDTGGESVEGGFVDRWVPNAHVACEELEAVFERDGFLPEYQAQLREALCAEGVPHAAAAQLLIWLKAYTRPLIEELLQADRPHVRAIGVAAAATVLPADTWLPALRDASPQVRLVAVCAISEQSRTVPDADVFLLQALGAPDVGVRRAAAISLGHMADVRALALLTREYANPNMAFARRELESAISAVTTRPPPALTPAERELLGAQITRQIDALRPTALGDWTLRVCKEELHALPVLGNQIYLWALRPDGTVLCMDHEAFTHPSEPETDPLTCFAVAVAAARSNPELSALIPACPRGARPCRPCSASGVEPQPDGSSISCLSCGGRGWYTR
jgi:hypothetical protein